MTFQIEVLFKLFLFSHSFRQLVGVFGGLFFIYLIVLYIG